MVFWRNWQTWKEISAISLECHDCCSISWSAWHSQTRYMPRTGQRMAICAPHSTTFHHDRNSINRLTEKRSNSAGLNIDVHWSHRSLHVYDYTCLFFLNPLAAVRWSLPLEPATRQNQVHSLQCRSNPWMIPRFPWNSVLSAIRTESWSWCLSRSPFRTQRWEMESWCQALSDIASIFTCTKRISKGSFSSSRMF